MRIYAVDGTELMHVESLSRSGNSLVIKGKIMGAMPMAASLSPEEARKGLGLLSASLVGFLLTFLFRKTKKKSAKRTTKIVSAKGKLK